MTTNSTGLIALVAVASLLFGATAADAGTLGGGATTVAAQKTGLQSTTPAATTRKIALGVSQANDTSLDAVDAFTASVGRAPAIWSIWSNWGGTDGPFPTSLVAGLNARQIVPMIFWQPTNPGHDTDSSYSYKSIMGGSHDAYIRAWATAAKASGQTIILRFAHEMNGSWFPWGVCRFTNTAAKFVKMWRHVWRIFRGPHGVGATNVKFLWNPYAPGQSSECGSYKALYPGDAFVDYAGFTDFNWAKKRNGVVNYRSMVKVFTAGMKALKKVTKKPVIVGETGTTSRGGNKPAWIRKGYPAVYKAFPRIKAIVYFDLDMRADGQPNWLLTDPAKALTAYAKTVADPRFQGTIH